MQFIECECVCECESVFGSTSVSAGKNLHPPLTWSENLCSAIPENRSFFGRFFSLTTACFFVRSLVSFLSDAGDVGDAGVWLRLRRAKSWREIPSRALA